MSSVNPETTKKELQASADDISTFRTETKQWLIKYVVDAVRHAAPQLVDDNFLDIPVRMRQDPVAHAERTSQMLREMTKALVALDQETTFRHYDEDDASPITSLVMATRVLGQLVRNLWLTDWKYRETRSYLNDLFGKCKGYVDAAGYPSMNA